MAASLRSKVKQAASNDEPLDASPPDPVDLEISLSEHREAYEIYLLQSRVETLFRQNQEALDMHGLRIGYARDIYNLVRGWLYWVCFLVCLSGFKLLGFNLSDSVLIAFITSTTVNVVGLFLVVAKWMYGSDAKQQAQESLAMTEQVPKGSTRKTEPPALQR